MQKCYNWFHEIIFIISISMYFAIFLSLRFYVESILGILEMQNLPF